jgi:transcriptional regulator with XRE-family HTH domain
MKMRRQRPKNVIGPAVKRRRSEIGWSQANLAVQCQVMGWDASRSIIAAIEGRVRWVGDYEIALLAKILSVSIEALYPRNIDWQELELEDISTPRRARR